MGDNYTIIAPDFFFHNENNLAATHAEWWGFSKNQLAEILFAFVQNFKNIKAVVGYSLGGKLALTLLEIIKNNPVPTVLVAPDGLVIHHWYKWVSQVPVLRKIYLHLIENPKIFFSFINLAKRLGLMHEKQHRFLTWQMGEKANREKIYWVWMLLRRVDPDYLLLKEQDLSHLHLFMGKYDKIIPLKYARKFCKDTDFSQSKVHIIKNGHDFMKATALSEVSQLIKSFR